MTSRRAAVSLVAFLLLVGSAHAGTTHTVRRGQTLFSIARSYGLSVQALARANRITDPSQITAGQRLVIPQTKRAADGRPPAGRAAPAVKRPPVPSAVRAFSESMQWPVDGPIISPFAAPRRGGQRRHKGVDIKSPEGAPIRAVAGGVVVTAQEHHGGFGRLVTIDHGEGITTFYGHNSRNLVKPGQQVAAGEVIALVGRTGNASCDHLHFELRKDGEAVDPARLLPDAGTARAATRSLADRPREPAARPAVRRALYPSERGKGPPPE